MDDMLTLSIDDALGVIINNDERQTPIIDEITFINNVLPILVNPWKPDHLERYRQYVHELNNPLRVAGIVEDGKTEVIFTIPALYPRPQTTSVSKAEVVTVAHVVNYIAQQRERMQQDNLQPVLLDFLKEISSPDPIVDTVIRPIAMILAKYGRTFEDDDGNPLYTLKPGQTQVQQSSTASVNSGASFSDELDD